MGRATYNEKKSGWTRLQKKKFLIARNFSLFEWIKGGVKLEGGEFKSPTALTHKTQRQRLNSGLKSCANLVHVL